MEKAEKHEQIKEGFLRTKGYVGKILIEMGNRIGGVEEKVGAITPRVEGECLIFGEEEGVDTNA